MKIEKDVKKTLHFNPKRCNDLFVDLVENFQKHKPTVGEIIIALGNLCYTLGASIGKFPKEGPSFEEVEKMYMVEPKRLDLALMMQGMLMTTWFSDWEKLQLENQEDEK